MGKKRQIDSYFWEDPYIEALQPLEKLLFVYLITTPRTNIAGSFEISLKAMRDHTKLTDDDLLPMLVKFERDRKFVYRKNWMLAVNARKHQNTNNTQIKMGIETILSNSPRWVIDELSKTPDESSHLDLNSDLDSDSNLIVGAASPNGESAQQKPARPLRTKESDPRKDHPAIKLTHEILTRWPHKDLWDRIIRELGDSPDVEFFRGCFEIWRSVDGNPMNLEKWLFTPNRTGKAPEIYGAKNGNTGKRIHTDQAGNEPSTEQYLREIGVSLKI